MLLQLRVKTKTGMNKFAGFAIGSTLTAPRKRGKATRFSQRFTAVMFLLVFVIISDLGEISNGFFD